MNGGVDRIDTSYEEFRTDVQRRLSTAKSKEEYISSCREIFQEILRRPDADKFLEIYRDEKTSFYDFTPDLIRHAKEIEEEYGKGGIDDCIGDDKTKISDVKYATNAIREELQPSKEKQEKRAENRGE